MRLFIADDSEILRTRLIEMLSELKDIEIIGHAEDSHEAVEVVERLKPNVVILDIRMPISITQQIRDLMKIYNSPKPTGGSLQSVSNMSLFLAIPHSLKIGILK